MTDFAAASAGISQLHARFVDAVWRKDFAAFGDCFAEDGEWKIAGMHMHGRAEIAEKGEALIGRCVRVHLIPGLPILKVEGRSAQGRMSMTEWAKLPDGSAFLTIGYYHDLYEQGDDGRWRFKWRHWSMKYRGPTPMDGDWADTPDYGAFPDMPAPDEETYIRKA